MWALQTFFSSHTIKSALLRFMLRHQTSLSMPRAWLGGRSVSLLQKVKQASSRLRALNFQPRTPAHFYVRGFLYYLHGSPYFSSPRHYCQRLISHFTPTHIYSPVCGLYVTVTSYPSPVFSSTQAYAASLLLVLKVTTSFAMPYWIDSAFLDIVT